METRRSPTRLWGGYFTLTRSGQEAPADGDRVVVVATIHLPAEPAENENDNPVLRLRKDITFGRRVEVAGDPLHAYWGKIGDRNRHHRVASKSFAADRWSEATRAARAWAESELKKIDEALEKRAKALANA